MSQHPSTQSSESRPNNSERLTEQQLAELADKQKQEEYRKAYLAQIRQQHCPGCGEAELF